MLKSSYKSKSDIINEWLNDDYIKKTSYSENIKHKTLSNQNVRSKAEAMIDTALFHNKIPYRYECLLELGELSFYPDFTILHPKTEKIYYWEHFGMMDNNRYAVSAISKLQTYCLNNIIPSVNLIVTFETKENPLNMYQIDKIICDYFK